MVDLVTAGFPYDVVLHRYSRDELELYWAAVQRKRARDKAELLATVRLAMHGAKARTKKYLRELQAIGDRLDEAMGLKAKTDFVSMLQSGDRLRFKQNA